jgi:hypothetical protein
MAPQPPQGQEIDISQIIGMVIALIAVFYTVGSSIYDLFFRKKPKVEQKEEQEEPLEDWLSTLERREEEERERAAQEREEEEKLEEEHEYELKKEIDAKLAASQQPQKSWVKPEEKFVFHTKIEDYRPKTAIEERNFEVKLRTGDELVSKSLTALAATNVVTGQKKKKSSIQDLVRALPSKQALIIATEIIRPPVGMRRGDDK